MLEIPEGTVKEPSAPGAPRAWRDFEGNPMNCEQTRQTRLDSLEGPITTELRVLMDNHIATRVKLAGGSLSQT